LSIWIWLVLCPIALEYEPIVQTLLKQQKFDKKDTPEMTSAT